MTGFEVESDHAVRYSLGVPAGLTPDGVDGPLPIEGSEAFWRGYKAARRVLDPQHRRRVALIDAVTAAMAEMGKAFKLPTWVMNGPSSYGASRDRLLRQQTRDG